MTLQEQIRANRWRTAVVLGGFGLLIAVFVLAIGGAYDPGLAGVVGIIAIGYGVISYFASGRIIAAVSGAKPVTKQELPRVYRLLENVSIAAGLDRTPDALPRPGHVAQRVRRRARPQARLRRGHHRHRRADGRPRAGGRAGARDRAHPQPRRPADEHRRGAGGRDLAGGRHADAHHVLRRHGRRGGRPRQRSAR